MKFAVCNLILLCFVTRGISQNNDAIQEIDKKESILVNRGNGEKVIQPNFAGNLAVDKPKRPEQINVANRPFQKFARGELQVEFVLSNVNNENPDSSKLNNFQESEIKKQEASNVLYNQSKPLDSAAKYMYKYKLSENNEWNAVADEELKKKSGKLKRDNLENDLNNLKKVIKGSESFNDVNFNRDVIVENNEAGNQPQNNDVLPDAPESLDTEKNNEKLRLDEVRFKQPKAEVFLHNQADDNFVTSDWHQRRFDAEQQPPGQRQDTGVGNAYGQS